MCEAYMVDDSALEVHTLDGAFRITIESVAPTNKLTM